MEAVENEKRRIHSLTVGVRGWITPLSATSAPNSMERLNLQRASRI